MNKVVYTNKSEGRGVNTQCVFMFNTLIGFVETRYENAGWGEPTWHSETMLGDKLGVLHQKGLNSEEITVYYARKLFNYLGLKAPEHIQRVDWRAQVNNPMLWKSGNYTNYGGHTTSWSEFARLNTKPDFKQLEWNVYKFPNEAGVTVGSLVREFALPKVQAREWTHPEYGWSPLYFKNTGSQLSEQIKEMYKDQTIGRTGQLPSWHAAMTAVQVAFAKLVEPRILM